MKECRKTELSFLNDRLSQSKSISLLSHEIFKKRSTSFTGKCWMDALELSLRCTNLLMKSMKKDSTGSMEGNEVVAENEMSDSSLPPSHQDNDHDHDGGDSMDESDCEKHFANQGKLFYMYVQYNSNVLFLEVSVSA